MKQNVYNSKSWKHNKQKNLNPRVGGVMREKYCGKGNCKYNQRKMCTMLGMNAKQLQTFTHGVCPFVWEFQLSAKGGRTWIIDAYRLENTQVTSDALYYLGVTIRPK